MAVSVLSAFLLLFFLAFSGHGNNFLILLALAFLIINIFYIFISRPTIKTSELLTRASAGLAIISFELQFRAQEAKNREVEAEKNRFAEQERSQYKLKIAKDMLHHISPRLQIDQKEQSKSPRITHQLQLENGSVPPAVKAN